MIILLKAHAINLLQDNTAWTEDVKTCVPNLHRRAPGPRTFVLVKVPLVDSTLFSFNVKA